MTASSQPKRFLLIDNRSEYFLRNRGPLATYLVESGFEVHVATFQTRPEDIRQAKNLGIHFIDLNGTLAGIKALDRIVRTLNPCLAHVFTLKAALLTALVFLLNRNVPVVISVTGLGYIYTSRGRKAGAAKLLSNSILRHLVIPRVQKVIFQNTDDRSYFETTLGLPTTRSALIPGSGVDLAKFKYSPPPAGDPEVLFLGRLLEDKGIREFADAASLITRSRKDISFTIVGDLDPANPACIRRAELDKWVNAGAVSWEGYQENIPDRIARASILCFPSYREGLPKAVIEASACGRPTVGTDAPGVREAVEDGKTGLLVPVKNAQALAKALSELLDSPETREQLGYNARKTAENNFDVVAITKATSDLYRQLGVTAP